MEGSYIHLLNISTMFSIKYEQTAAPICWTFNQYGQWWKILGFVAQQQGDHLLNTVEHDILLEKNTLALK